MIQSLQSLRFIIILLIFLHHFGVNGKGLFEAGGPAGVTFFFILSGFVMSLGYSNKIESENFDYREFILKRIAKIYPLHLLCLFIWIILSYKSLFSLHNLALVPNTLLLQSWIPIRGLSV